MSKTKTMTAGTTASAADVNQNFDELGTLGDAQVTANQGTFTALTDLTGLTVSITVSAAFAAAGRKIKIIGVVRLSSSVTTDTGVLSIREGGTTLQSAVSAPLSSSATVEAVAVIAPTAGAHTYKLSAARNTGTGNITMVAAGTAPAIILVEAI